MTMNALLKSVLLCAVLLITVAYMLAEDTVDDVPLAHEDGDDISYLSAVFKRNVNATRTLCLPWMKPCTHNQTLIDKYSFLKCCNNGVCQCSLMGNCRCQARLGR